MPYIYCMPATITEFNHSLDNRVSGKLEVEGREISFTSRKHIVLATNRHYSKCAWKPRLGSLVLIDGELGKTSVLVDHIEDDLASDGFVQHPILDQIAASIRAIPNATKTLRHWKPADPQAPMRFRWAGEVGKSVGLDADKGILHAIYDPVTGEWKAWCVDASTGRMAARGLPPGAMRLVDRTFLAPEEKKKGAAPKKRPVPKTVPFDDCPF